MSSVAGGGKKEQVTFRWAYGGTHVLLAGSFSDWKGLPMIPDPSLPYHSVLTIGLEKGTYQYKYIVDGLWFYDTEVEHATEGGNINNVITVGDGAGSTHSSAKRSGLTLIPYHQEPLKVTGQHPPNITPLFSKLVNLIRKDNTFNWEIQDNLTNVHLIFPTEGTKITGDAKAAKYLALVDPLLGIYGVDALTTLEVDNWIEYAGTIETTPKESFGDVIAPMHTHLRLRTYFVGHHLSLADIYIWVALAKNQYWGDVVSTNKAIKYKYLVRWWNYVNSLEEFVTGRQYLPKNTDKKDQLAAGTFEDLVGGEMGKVVCRFPPEPSGYLHIGHAKAAFLNDYYVRKYKGTLILRFDDTNPTKEKDEYETAILQDLETMGIRPHKSSHTSDYFGHIESKAEELIKAGKAFVDDLPAEEITVLRDNFKPSPSRSNSIEKNLAMWQEMKDGTEKGKTYVLRAKIDYTSDNGTMRDPAIYRYLGHSHNRTGDRFKVYPLYHFACPIVDSLEGVTHALRSNEYHDSEEQYYWFLKNVPGLQPVIIKDFSRVNFTYTLLSKRKLNWFVDKKIVDDWTDPRFPTVRGMIRRGLRMESLKDYIFSLGDSKNTVCMEILNLWALNKKFIDRIIPRYTAVRNENVVILSLDTPAKPEPFTAARHKQNPDLGTKTITRFSKVYIEQQDAQSLAPNEEVTLMDWGNAIITSIKKSGDLVTALEGKLHLEGDYKKTTHRLTWLPVLQDKLTNVTLIEYGNLITEKVIPKKANWEDYINPETKFETEAYGDINIESLKKGEQFQLERIGYFVKDSEIGEKPVRLVLTPDGHSTNKFFLSTKPAEKK